MTFVPCHETAVEGDGTRDRAIVALKQVEQRAHALPWLVLGVSRESSIPEACEAYTALVVAIAPLETEFGDRDTIVRAIAVLDHLRDALYRFCRHADGLRRNRVARGSRGPRS